MSRERTFALGLVGGRSLGSFAGPVLSVSRRAQDDTVFLASRFGVILSDQRERVISGHGLGGLGCSVVVNLQQGSNSAVGVRWAHPRLWA
jgi:hypothetical protein